MAETLRVALVREQRELHRVLPLAVAHIGTPLHTLPHESDALRVPDRCLVEAVTRELETVEAKLVEEIPHEQARSRVRDATAPERRGDGERLEVHDAVHLAQLAVAERARALTVELGDHPSEALRLALRALDVRKHLGAATCPLATEERLDVLVGVEGDEPVDVL